MWYEILPSFGIICAAMTAPPFISYLLNKAVFGTGYRKQLLTVDQRMQYLRDRRLTGDPYKSSGLENLPSK